MRGAGTALVSALSIAAGLALWELLARGAQATLVAPPSLVFARLAAGLASGTLPVALAGSLAQLVLGFALAVLIGVPLGLLIGRNPRLAEATEPVLNAIYAVPPVALVPFLLIWFGLFFEARVALVFVMSFFEILVTVAAGARNIDPALLAVGRSFGAGRTQLLASVVFPAALPFLFTALRVGLVRAINGMITAELFLAAVNLGALMKQSAQRFDTAGLLAIVVLLCLLGLVAQEGMKAAEQRLLPWHLRA
jgi:NitT/TauT family transport system permease protein